MRFASNLLRWTQHFESVTFLATQYKTIKMSVGYYTALNLRGPYVLEASWYLQARIYSFLLKASGNCLLSMEGFRDAAFLSRSLISIVILCDWLTKYPRHCFAISIDRRQQFLLVHGIVGNWSHYMIRPQVKILLLLSGLN